MEGVPVREPVAEARALARRGTGTVLVVEDDDMVRVLARRLLESFGYRVLVASDGASALDMVRQHPGPSICSSPTW